MPTNWPPSKPRLSPHADILIYGCDVAAGAKGQAFVASLAAATGADIAASTNTTGAPSHGGDWVLETVSGPIETVRLTLKGFEGVLTVAPTITDSVTTTRTTREDTSLAISGITVADVEDPAVMRASISITGGTITLAGSGWTVTGGANGSSAVTIEGTVAQINSAIDGMSFNPEANQNSGIPGYTPKIDLSVSDVTNSDGPTTFSITNLAVTPVNDAPSIAGGVPLVVSEGGTGSFAPPTTVGSGFTQSQLGLTDVDTSASQTIIKIASVPGQGVLRFNGNQLAVGSTLSVSDINKLSYTHDGSQVTGATADTFSLTVDDGAGGLLVSQPVSVIITPVNQPPSLGGNITVIEGETGVRLDNNGLLPPPLSTGRGAISVSDPEGAAISTYNITSLPAHGRLFYNGVPIVAASPGTPFVVGDITKLTYSHDGSETVGDSFDMRVTDDGGGTGVPATTSSTINLTIYPNDDDPVLATDIDQIMAGTSLTITPAMLQVTDPDSPDTTLTYTLTGVPDPALGYFTLKGQTLTPGATFTQADIAAGNLVYVNRSIIPTPRTDSISFTVKDGEERIYPTIRDGGIYNPGTDNLTVNTFNIIIPPTVIPDPNVPPPDVPVNTAPTVDGSNSATLLENETVFLTNSQLHITDNDNSPGQLVYRLSSLPTSGAITRNGLRLRIGQAFTQDDVNNNRVRFVHAGGEDFIDSFTYTVSDGSSVSAKQTFNFNTTPQNDTPTASTGGRIFLAEGSSFTINNAHITLSDADNSASDLIPETGYAINNDLSFRITGNVAHGALTLSGAPVVPGVTIVTSAQLANGDLVYTHDGSENFSDSFKLVPVDDQNVTTPTPTNQSSTGAELTVPITMYPMNDAETYFSKKELTSAPGQAGPIQEGATATIGGAASYAVINSVPGSGVPTPSAGAHLVFGDDDNSSVQRQFRVMAAPVNGKLLRNGAQMGVGSVFTQADLDSGAITYKHSGTETYTDSFSYLVSDGDYIANDNTISSQGNPPPVPSTYLIEITPRNDVPTLNAPGSLDAFAPGAGTTGITGITLADVDLADGITAGETNFVRVEVRVLDNTDTLVAAAQLNYTAADPAAPASGGAYNSGKGTNSLVVQGTKAEIDAILASLTVAFTADLDAGNYKIRLTADDRLYDGSGALTTNANGGPAPFNADGTPIDATNNRVTKDILLRASNFNDPPTIINPSLYSVNEDAQVTLAGFTVADVDSFGEDVTVTVRLYADAGRTTLANAGTQGRLILGATTGLTSFTGNNTNTITLTGSITEVQAALNDLKFAGVTNYNDPGVGFGNLYLQTTIADFAHADGQKTALVDNTITIVPVNDLPTLSVPGDKTLDNGTSIAISSGFAVGDAVDISQGAADYVEVTVAATLSGAPYGTVTVIPQGGATVTDNGTATIVVKGTTADVQATLNQMTYAPTNPNVDNTVLITSTVNDLNNGAEGVGVTGNNTRTGTFIIRISNVNEPPAVTAPVSLTVNEDSSNNLVAGVSFTDSDDFGALERVTLNLGASPKGTITLNTITGLTFTTGDGTDDTLMVFTGTKAAINNALATLRFTPTTNRNTVGVANAQPLTITVDDQGNTGSGGALSDTETVLITINPINDAPTRTGPTTTLTNVPEDTADPPGNTVTNLFNPRFSDNTDNQTGGSTANLLAGVAIVSNAATVAQGRWQYNSGLGWTNLPVVSLTTPFLLKTTDQVRFLPTANWNGSPGVLTVRLIDDSAGPVTTGPGPNLSGAATGGTTRYSNSSNAVTLNTAISPVNDAPVASGTSTLTAVNEDTINPPGAAVSALITGANYSDVTDTIPGGSTGTALGGIAIVGNAADAATQGTWQYSTNAGVSWTAVPTSGLGDSSALLLPTTARLRFVPVANYNGTPGSLSVRLADSVQALNTSANISAQVGGTGTWSAAAIPIATLVNPVNDVPTIAGASSIQSYTENASPVVLEPGVSLADVDDTQIDRAVISISGGFVPGDRLNFINQLGITGSYNAGTGVLTLTGTTSLANYQTALRSIGFDSTSDNPGNGTRTISWTVRDVNAESAINGQQTSLAATTTVNVTPVNDTPDISGLDAISANSYTENGPAVQMDSNVVLADPELDGTNWNGATLTLERSGGANAEDVFSGTGALSLSGGNVIVSGITVGTYTQSGGTLNITFNAAATAARADAVIQGLAYRNTSENPPVSVTIDYTVNDQNPNIAGGGIPGSGVDQGSGGRLIDSGSILINIIPVNDPPVNTVPGPQTIPEDNNLVITGLSVADVDNASLTTTLSLPPGSGLLTVTAGSGATITGDGTGTVTIAGTQAQINAALAAIIYTPTADFNTGAGSIDLTVATTDGSLTDSDTVAITVTPVPDIVADSVTTPEDTAITFNAITGTNGASADNFENPGRAVTAVTQGAHGTVSFAADGTLTYTPDANYNGPDSFTYTVTSGGVTETATVTVNVTPVNDVPVNTVPGPQSTPEDTGLTISGLSVGDVRQPQPDHDPEPAPGQRPLDGDGRERRHHHRRRHGHGDHRRHPGPDQRRPGGHHLYPHGGF